MLSLELPTWNKLSIVAPAFSATAAPFTLIEVLTHPTRPMDYPVVSDPASVTVYGGTPPYTYWWAPIGATSITVTSPGSPSTTFNADPVAAIFSFTQDFTCTVTDSLANVVVSNKVRVTLMRGYES